MNLKLSLLELWRFRRTLLGTPDPGDPSSAVPVSETAPLPVRVVGAAPGDDAASAREATLLQLRDAVLAGNGHTDGLEGLLGVLLTSAQFQARVPTNGQKTKAGSLPVTLASDQDALNVQRAAPGTTTHDASIAAGQSLGAAVALAGRTPLRLIIGASWTAADITVQTSLDGITWADLYDSYGGVYTIRVAASRSVIIPAADLVGINHIRLRSGTPTAAVAQAQAGGASLTLVAQVL